MCESTVILKLPEGDRELMTEVVHLSVSGNKITISNLLGDEKTVEGVIDSIDFLAHKLYVTPT
jgi:predicted RNA-binding protein